MVSYNPFEYSLLTSRVNDATKAVRARNTYSFIGFLNEFETEFIKNIFKKDHDISFAYWGGYDNAERVIFAVYRSGVVLENNKYPISKICFEFKPIYNLTHRDFLGAFMSKGIKRECIGDIIVINGQCIAFVKSEVKEYLLLQINKVGNVGVVYSDPRNVVLPSKKEFTEISVIVSSCRLDNIVSALLNISRNDSGKYIKSGLAFINYIECTSTSRIIKPFDVISLRGKGKFIITEKISQTHKGRLRINLKKY